MVDGRRAPGERAPAAGGGVSTVAGAVSGRPGVGHGARATVESLRVAAATVPTETPESDGTLSWHSTTIVVVTVQADGRTGTGWTYAHHAVGSLVDSLFRPLVEGADALGPQRVWEAMRREARNLGRPGLVSCAMSAVDTALWDLKARLLDVSLADLFGALRDTIPVYGSGGFTSYDVDRLREQLGGWAGEGLRMVKMKIGRDPDADVERVAAARDAIGPGVELFVDANGAHTPARAIEVAHHLAPQGVTWFEEPVSSDDLVGLRRVRDAAPPGMAITAGEYGYDLPYFRRMLEAGAVDVLQPDATRCGGFTGFLRAADLCEAHGTPLSAHTAPNLHAHVCLAAPRAVHLEWFHDHVRIERMLFEGPLEPVGGALRPDRSRPGNGLELDRDALERHAAPRR